ncbi:MAG: hypothetical protein V1725_03420 [archaeon]
MDISQIIEVIKHPGIAHLQTYILAGIGMVISATGSILHEREQAKTIPLAYAEIETIQKQLHEEKPLTQMLACTNDFCMNIFEAYNASHNKTQFLQNGFGESLRERTSDYQGQLGIRTLATEAVRYAKEVKEKLTTHIAAIKMLEEAISNFDDAWDESHIDHYRTEIYWDTEVYTDSQGHTQTRQVMRTRQVYDHTTHTYEYNPDAGIRAATSMHELLTNIPKLNPFETIETAASMSEHGRIAASRSRKKALLLPEECEHISTLWKEGTAHDDHLDAVVGSYATLPDLTAVWDEEEVNAKPHYCYDTYSSYDDGPEPYRAAKHVQATAEDITEKIGSLLSDIELITNRIPKLQENIEKYVLMIQQPKELKKLRKEIMHDAKDVYTTVFSQGIDVDRFKEWHVGLWTLLGTTAGAGLGVLGEYLLQ